MHLVRLLLAVTSIVALGACASRIPDPKPNWAQATGQIQSTGGKVAIVGEIVIRYDNENFLAEISKGPSSPLLRLYGKGAHAEHVTANFVGRGTWSGSPAKAPDALKTWVALPEVFHRTTALSRGNKSYAIHVPGVELIRTTFNGGKITHLEYQLGAEKVVCRLQ